MFHTGNPPGRDLKSPASLPEGKVLCLMVLTPAFTLLAYWLGGENALVFTALAIPLAAGVAALRVSLQQSRPRTDHSALLSEWDFHALVTERLENAQENNLKSAVFYLSVDEWPDLVERFGADATDRLDVEVAARIRSSLRQSDSVGKIAPGQFAVLLEPQKFLDLEICLEVARRMSRAAAEPYAIDGASVFLTLSIGFCQSGKAAKIACEPGTNAVALCAQDAMAEARGNGHGSIRAYAPRTKSAIRPIGQIDMDETVEALESGQIVAWFQPQSSNDTGRVTGFEALARWIHPVRGLVPPGDFLPHLERAQKMGQLCESMLYQSFSAMRAWDAAGVDVGQVGVNFSSEELSDPGLVEKVCWELDRFELTPNRLAVEIVETVVAQGPDDVITRNINGLRDLGCSIDLDDFGTGHASLASIRRFGVSRIKIDRTFVMKCDRDAEQQRMIRAILTLAEKLDLETVAEGVETIGEHSLLAQLGCTHVQGFGIGKPMPFQQTLAWIGQHNAKLQDPPMIGRVSR